MNIFYALSDFILAPNMIKKVKLIIITTFSVLTLTSEFSTDLPSPKQYF